MVRLVRHIVKMRHSSSFGAQMAANFNGAEQLMVSLSV